MVKLTIKICLFCFLAAILTVSLVYIKAISSDSAILRFYLILDKAIYTDSIYGEQPQIAIWLENMDNGSIKNVWVSQKSAGDNWVGKTSCPISLPFWSSFSRMKQNVTDYDNDKRVDAFTMATPRSDFIKAKANVDYGSKWRYYIEVNAAGDFNSSFPYRHPDGYPDMLGNGQPSIVYKGTIKAIRGEKDVPLIVGRTEQWEAVDALNDDLDGITTASKIFREVRVSCGVFF